MEPDNNSNEIEKYNAAGDAPDKKRKINLPNKLTVFRIILVPVIMVFVLLPESDILNVWPKIFAAALFLIASLTDFIDGVLARKLNLITDFGKFMDPLADKFLVAGAMIAITAASSFSEIRVFSACATAVIVFRDLAVNSIRVVASSADGNVIAANFAGKLKTFSQCVCIMTIFLEEAVLSRNIGTPPYLFSYITIAVMCLLTIYSGFVYLKTYWRYIDPAK